MRFVGWFAYYFARVATTVIGKVMWRMEVRGVENLPKEGSFLLCPVHRSNIDGPLSCTWTPRRMRYLAKDGLFKYNGLRQLFHHMGAIPVNRDGVDRKSLKACMAAIEAGYPLVLFPEGGRRDGPVVQNVQEGAAYLAIKAKVPVVPVGIKGSEEAQPRGSKRLRFTKMVVVIGEPFEITGASAASRSALREGTEMIRTRLQAAFDEAMGKSVGN